MVIMYQYFSTLAMVRMALAAQAYVAQFLETFRELPPRQKPASFSIDQVMEKLQTSGGSK